jgi:hypothetical protein
VTRDTIIGLDFSGARTAGRTIWLTTAIPQPTGLEVVACQPAAALARKAVERTAALAVLRDRLGSLEQAAVGCDFPFSLPAPLLGSRSFSAFLADFATAYADADDLREKCQTAADGRELKRATDRHARTPFSPYNLRMFRQTFFGIRDLLAPLVQAGTAAVVPIDPPTPEKLWLLEVCPASRLKKLSGLYAPYKGRDRTARHQREKILAQCEADGLTFASAPLRDAILADAGGDALDSLLAAAITDEHTREPPGFPPGWSADSREGLVYC